MAYLSIYYMFSLVFILKILIPGYSCYHLTDTSRCRDVYIWMLDGIVDCKYLEQYSNYGVHKNPKYYCTQYSQTDCCETCTRLGFKKGRVTPLTTTLTYLNTTAAPTTNAPSTVIQRVRETLFCRDFGVWIASGLASCRYLQTESYWGLHKKADYYCNIYPLTWCCRTCSNINGRVLYNLH